LTRLLQLSTRYHGDELPYKESDCVWLVRAHGPPPEPHWLVGTCATWCLAKARIGVEKMLGPKRRHVKGEDNAPNSPIFMKYTYKVLNVQWLHSLTTYCFLVCVCKLLSSLKWVGCLINVCLKCNSLRDVRMVFLRLIYVWYCLWYSLCLIYIRHQNTTLTSLRCSLYIASDKGFYEMH
jgi:hypothetical protein